MMRRLSASSSSSSSSLRHAMRRFLTNEAAEVQPPPDKIVLFGGNGYVGQNMIRVALQLGYDVISISRTGSPKKIPKDFSKVTWVEGDLLGNRDQWKSHLENAKCACSTVGAFGSNAYMEKVNGDANINAISACLSAGVQRFTYVSTVDNNLPEFILSGIYPEAISRFGLKRP